MRREKLAFNLYLCFFIDAFLLRDLLNLSIIIVYILFDSFLIISYKQVDRKLMSAPRLWYLTKINKCKHVNVIYSTLYRKNEILLLSKNIQTEVLHENMRDISKWKAKKCFSPLLAYALSQDVRLHVRKNQRHAWVTLNKITNIFLYLVNQMDT
jgi:hypothetical protein